MKKGIGDKLLGLFIVAEDEDAGASASPRHGEDATENDVEAPAIPVTTPPRAKPAGARAAVVAPGAPHDTAAFAAVYRAAGLPDEDRERLAKVIGLVGSLPPEATPEVRRAIVGASLAAFGVPIDRIVATADAAAAALDGYVVEGQRRTKEVLAQAESRIARLEAEIEEVRQLMALQVESERELVRATTAEKARVRIASEFFASKSTPRPDEHDSPRLRRVQ